MSTTVKANGGGGGFIGFFKSISLKTWLIGGFVVLFLIWFIPRIKTFARIAGILGLAAALAFLAPFILPVVAGLLGGLAAGLAAAIVAAKKGFKEGNTDEEAKETATETKEGVDNTVKQEAAEANRSEAQVDSTGVEGAKLVDENSEAKSTDVEPDVNDYIETEDG